MALINILWLLLAFVVAFFLGSLPFSVWIGTLATGTDLREQNIGNPGGFNAMMTYGAVVGLSITFLDLGKGILAIALIDHIFSLDYFSTGGLNYWHIIGCILGPAICALGHNYSPFLKFKGGRGVGVLMGTLIYMNPLVYLTYMIVIAILVQGLKQQSRFASAVGSIFAFIAGLFIPIYPPWTNILTSWIVGANGFLFPTQGFVPLGLFLAILPKLWTGIIQTITGKGKDWGFDIRKGQDLDDV